MVELVDLIREEHPGCGIEKMYHILNPQQIGRDKFVSILMERGYRVRKVKNYSKTTYSTKTTYKNLIQGMLLWDKNQLWQSDITYFRLKDECAYIVFIIDVYTKKVIGYQASDHQRATANIKTLKMAFSKAGEIPRGMIHHSDRRSQYRCLKYVKLLKDRGIWISMGLKGMDNAYAERINGIIKNEYLNYWHIEDLPTLKRRLKKAVNNYNTHRIHNSLSGKQTPSEFENKLLNLPYQKRHFWLMFVRLK